MTFLSNPPYLHCKNNFSVYPKHTLFSYLPSLDVNDNVPFFTSSIYEASVTEGAESGTLVFQVSANDLDLGLNGKVKTYSSTHKPWFRTPFKYMHSIIFSLPVFLIIQNVFFLAV